MPWYVVNYKPGEGDRAELNLKNQSITCFFPKIKVERLRSGKRTYLWEPLFKGYLFVHLSLEDPQWSRVPSTRGVLRVLSFGGRPPALSDEMIGQIRNGLAMIEDDGGLKPGSRIRFRTGPFQGREAMFEAYDGEQRAMVLIEFMQTRKRISVPLAYL